MITQARPDQRRDRGQRRRRRDPDRARRRARLGRAVVRARRRDPQRRVHGAAAAAEEARPRRARRAARVGPAADRRARTTAPSGTIPWQVWPASIPYGLLCTAVLMAKHIDKLPWDEKAGVGTLPVHPRRGARADGHERADGRVLCRGRRRRRGRRAAVAGAGGVRRRCRSCARALKALRRPKPAAAAARLPDLAAVVRRVRVHAHAPRRSPAGRRARGRGGVRHRPGWLR